MKLEIKPIYFSASCWEVYVDVDRQHKFSLDSFIFKIEEALIQPKCVLV